MGFQIFLMAFEGGEFGRFDRKIAERAFRHIVDCVEDDCWQIVLPDGPCLGQIHISKAAQIERFSVERPPFVPLFWDALFDLMRQTPTILFWPGGMDPDPICCVANTGVLSELPADMFEKLIPPAMVACGADIEDCIARNA